MYPLAEGKQQGGVQSLERVFGLMELMASEQRAWTLTELTERSGLHKSTVHRLLSALAARGYVRQEDRGGRYRLGIRLFELGARAIGAVDLLENARLPMELLSRQTNESIHLVVPDGADIVYVHKVDASDNAIRMASSVGMRRPMYCTAVGKSMLALLQDDQVRQLWEASTIVSYTAHTITSLNLLLAELSEIRKIGYALDNEENEPGVRCIGTAIADFTGYPAAAISVSAPLSRMSDERIQEISGRLLEARDRIAATL